MFDILCDVWSRPGVSHSPILPLDVSKLTAENAESEISRLHRSGLDSLYLISRTTVNETVIDSVFAAAAKRYMLVFVDGNRYAGIFIEPDEAMRAYFMNLGKTKKSG